MSVMKHIMTGCRKNAIQIEPSKFSINSRKNIGDYIRVVLSQGKVSGSNRELTYIFPGSKGANIDGVPTQTVKVFLDARGGLGLLSHYSLNE